MYDTLYISPNYFLHMPINKLQPDIQIIDKINTQIYQICKVFIEKHKARVFFTANQDILANSSRFLHAQIIG